MTIPENMRQDETEDSDEVLLAFSQARAAAPGDKTLLREWTARYPAVADEMMTIDYARFAGGLTLSDAVADGSEDAAVAALGREAVAARRRASDARPPLTSLAADAAARGMDVPMLAEALRLDRLLLGRLEQRVLEAATLPVSLVRQIAGILERETDEVAAFLRGSPRLPAQAHFRSSRAPSLAAPAGAALQTSFAEAVQAGRNLSAEDKAYWQGEIDAGVLGDE